MRAYGLESRLRKLEGGTAVQEPRTWPILTLVDLMAAVEYGDEFNFDTTPEPLLRLLHQTLSDPLARLLGSRLYWGADQTLKEKSLYL